MTVQEVCNRVGIDVTTYYDWSHKNAEFSKAITRATQVRAGAYLDRAVHETLLATDRESAHVARVRADVMLKVAQLSDPARFAQHQKVEHSESPIKVIELPADTNAKDPNV